MTINDGEGLLDWKSLDHETIWLKRHRGVRWHITNREGVSTLTKVHGYGEKFNTEVRARLPDKGITIATLDYFETIVKNDELPASMRKKVVRSNV